MDRVTDSPRDSHGILRGLRQDAALVTGLTLVTIAALIIVMPFVSDTPVGMAIVAGVVYLVSHVFRAIRLAMLCVDSLGVSARTTVLMHLSTAPLALAFPLKLGELLRLHELWKLSGTLVYAFVGLLIDRMYDSLFLIPIMMVLLATGSGSAAFVTLTLLAAIIPLLVILFGPRLLADLQRYVVAHHNNPRTLYALRQIDAARVVVIQAADVAWLRAPQLGILTALIWFYELLFCFIVARGFAETATFSSVIDLLGSRLVASWWTAQADSLVQTSLAIGTIAMLVIWPGVLILYLRRRKHEPRRAASVVQRQRRGIA